MKRNKIIYMFATLAIGLLMSCDKDTEGISRTTFFPDFEMAGEEVMTVVQGEEFVDPGVTASANEQELDVSVSVLGSPFIVPGQTQPSQVQYTNSLDTNVPGMYIITYSALNEDGFPGTTQRIVFVLDKPADPTVDLSGTYTSTAPSPSATITKVTDGVFFSSNVWGGGSTVVIPAYIVTADGINLQIPQQESIVRVFGYGTRNPQTGVLDMRVSRPTFANPAPLIDLVKVWTKVQ